MHEAIFYDIDASDLIVNVSAGWDAFAAANDGSSAVAERVLGQRLYRFVTGDATRMLIDVLLGRTRLLGTPGRLDYRCDSPELSRYMQMTITPLGGQGLRLEHRVLRTVRTGRIEFRGVDERDYPLVGAAPPSRGSDRWLRRCSMCNRVEAGGEWLEPERARSGAIIASGPNRVIYTVCEPCRNRIQGPNDHDNFSNERPRSDSA